MRSIFYKSLLLTVVAMCGIVQGRAKSTLNSTTRRTTSSALSSPVTRSPVQSPTSPVTSYSQGLYDSRRPSASSTNSIITGNVGGGRHFRGQLPYNPMTNFGGDLGSDDLDDFRRRSYISNDYLKGRLVPYYSRAATVTQTDPGSGAIIIPQTSKIRTQGLLNRAQSSSAAIQAELSRSQNTSFEQRSRLYPTDSLRDNLLLPLDSQNPQEQQQVRLRYEQQKKELQTNLGLLSQKASELRKDIQADLEGEEKERKEGQENTSLILKDVEDRREKQQHLLAQQTSKPVDVYEKMQLEYEQLMEYYQEFFPEEVNETMSGSALTKFLELPAKTKRRRDEEKASLKSQQDVAREGKDTSDIDARTKIILSKLESFTAQTDTQFNNYMRAAEEYMKKGKFYLASNAYAMASIYKPLDPLTYAGRSHALLAAGDYMSSAANLNEAIKLFPGYVDFRIDIVSMIGDKDTVEKRISDINAWIEVTSSPKLHFLQAYIYLQMDRLEKAQAAIDKAYGDLSNTPAVELLKKAIEKRRAAN